MNCQSTMQIIPETIIYGSKEIVFFLYREERKTMRILVSPELSVSIHAPVEIDLTTIRERIKKRWGWILRQLEFFSSFHPKRTVRKYLSGETHLYLGREYLLEVKISQDKESVKLKWKHIIVLAKESSRVEKLMNDWYSRHAKEKIQQFFTPLALQFKKYNVAPTELILRKMKLRWGSCSKNGKITLNSRLIEAPRWCIEYVIVHELCHLIQFGHTKKFYELQTKEMHTWKKWKEKLEQLLA